MVKRVVAVALGLAISATSFAGGCCSWTGCKPCERYLPGQVYCVTKKCTPCKPCLKVCKPNPCAKVCK